MGYREVSIGNSLDKCLTANWERYESLGHSFQISLAWLRGYIRYRVKPIETVYAADYS